MEDSVIYQALVGKGRAEGILEGRAEGARQTLLLIGERRFGSVTPEVRDALNSLPTAERIDALAARMFEVETWSELLALAQP